MIDQKAPEITRPGGPTVGRRSGHVANRARLNAVDGVPLHYRTWLPADRLRHRSAAVPPRDRQPRRLVRRDGRPPRRSRHRRLRAGSTRIRPERRPARPHPQLRAGARRPRPVPRPRGRSRARPLFLAGSSWAAKLAIASAARSPGGAGRARPARPRPLPARRPHRSAEAGGAPYPPRSARSSTSASRWSRTTTPATPSYLEYIRRDAYRLLTASSRLFWETRRLDRARDRPGGRARPSRSCSRSATPTRSWTPPATCAWLQRLGAPDRTTVVYRDAAHTLDFEPEPTVRAYRADLVGWLRRQIGRIDKGASDVR